MDMKIGFPGGMRVEASFQGFSVVTDQPVSAGGEGSAPSPFGIFLASIPTCAGFFALRFCQERGIDPEGMSLSASFARDAATGALTSVTLDLTLPPGFPEKYKKPILRAMDECSVKRALMVPPKFEITLS